MNGTIITDSIAASNFNTYFTSVAENLLTNIRSTYDKFTRYLKNTTIDSIFLSPTCPQEIITIISTFQLKLSCGIDDIPSKIVKHIPDNIIEILSYIFNLSLANGQYINCFKTSEVVPIFKKGGAKNCLFVFCYLSS